MDKICGIYKIESIEGCIYIGQSIDIFSRWKRHKRSVNTNYKTKLIISLKKHGVNNHKFDIVELCDKKDLIKNEQKWIKYYNSFNTNLGLNQSKGTGCGIPSEKSNKKNSNSQKLKYKAGLYNRNGINNGMYGKGYKLNGEKNGRYGKPVEDITRKKISNANKLYWKKIKSNNNANLLYNKVRRKHDHKKILELLKLGNSYNEIQSIMNLKSKSIITYAVKHSLANKLTKDHAALRS